jgi:hypothetical protein
MPDSWDGTAGERDQRFNDRSPARDNLQLPTPVRILVHGQTPESLGHPRGRRGCGRRSEIWPLARSYNETKEGAKDD